MDNKAFEDECYEAANATPGAENQNAGWEACQSTDWNEQAEDTPSAYRVPSKATSQRPVNQGVNVFDYEVSSFDDEKPAQEMQEKGGQGLLGQSTGQPSSAMDTEWDDVDDSSGTVSNSK